MGSIITLSIVQSALELGFIYALVALALFVSFSILDIADLSTDGCFTLGCAVCASVTLVTSGSGAVRGNGSRICIGIRYCIFTDQNGYSVDSGRNHCQHRIIYDQQQ